MSRVGRDYLQTGFYTEVVFKQHGIRFIAISNGVDSWLVDEETADVVRRIFRLSAEGKVLLRLPKL